jgi:S-methylmethionine-dependent homocysteine/selenocysteine methylase
VNKITLIDGPMGTLLGERGVDISGENWSANALITAPSLIQDIHREYVEAGATVHTTNTFRTRRRDLGEDWEELSCLAVQLAREAVPAGQRVAASISPLADCYRPDLSPPKPSAEHREFIELLASQSIDLFLCETFANPREALVAVHECVATGLPTWLSLCAGPHAELMSPEILRKTATRAMELGAEAVLVNCVDAAKTGEYVQALAGVDVPFGAYANAGPPSAGLGWEHTAEGPTRYLAYARRWLAAGATLFGCCCGTTPAHIATLRRSLLQP